MIYGEIKELNFYRGISSALDTAIDYILSGEYKNGKAGKNVVDGDTVYFNQPADAKTKNVEDGFFEGHKKYIDIHIVTEGSENIGYVPNSRAKISKTYDEEGDYELYEGKVETFFKLDGTNFLMCFPEEPHMALIKTGEKPEAVKKVIFKVLVK